MINKQIYRLCQQKQCLYKILNVSTNSTLDDIRQSYLDLAKRYHPDVIKDTEYDHNRFNLIQEAYQTLSNEQKRLDYDLSQGLRSEWKYYQGFDPSFGEQQTRYSHYYNQSSRQEQRRQDDYEQMNQYFRKKYFNNHSYYTVFDENVDDPYRASPHLMEQMALKRAKQNADPKYKVYYGSQKTPYYADIYEQKYEGKKYIFLLVLYDFRHPILIVLGGITIYQSFLFFQDYNKDKNNLQNPTQVTKGKGTIVKAIPLNIV